MSTTPIEAISAAASSLTQGLDPAVQAARGGSFPDMLTAGVNKLNQQLIDADALATRFVLDDGSIPVHQVTFALEQARMSVELMTQVRNQLLEGYQDLIKMQL